MLLIEKNKLLSDNLLKRKIAGSIGPQGRMIKVEKSGIYIYKEVDFYIG